MPLTKPDGSGATRRTAYNPAVIGFSAGIFERLGPGLYRLNLSGGFKVVAIQDDVL